MGAGVCLGTGVRPVQCAVGGRKSTALERQSGECTLQAEMRMMGPTDWSKRRTEAVTVQSENKDGRGARRRRLVGHVGMETCEARGERDGWGSCGRRVLRHVRTKMGRNCEN